MELDKKLHDEIKEYCKLNNLKMIQFINDLLKKAFLIEKYGDAPFKRELPIIESKQKIEEETKNINDVVNTTEKMSETTNNDEIIDNGIKFVEIKKTNKRKLK